MGGAPPANACEFIHQVIFCRMNDCFWPIVPFHSYPGKQSLSGTDGLLWVAMTIAYFRPEADAR